MELEKQIKDSKQFNYIDLPSEILRMIFLYALPPPFLFGTITQRPYTPSRSWMRALRFKKLLVRVSRHWHAVGSEFLYESVVFFHVHQVPPFLRTLETSPAMFGRLVTKITFSIYVPDKYKRSFQNRSQRIFDLCPRLTHIVFASLLHLYPFSALPTMRLHLTHLDFGTRVDYTWIYPLLILTSHSLLSLSFHFSDEIKPNMSNPIHFECLRSLRCDFGGYLATSRSVAASWLMLRDAWSIPNLEHFASKTSFRGLSADEISSFCTKHGTCLKSLRLMRSEISSRQVNIQPILDACPIINHLVFEASMVKWDNLAHPQVKWIDILLPLRNVNEGHRREWLDRCKKSFPALQGLRLISKDLESLDLPMHLLPHWITEPNDAYSIQFPGIRLRHDVGLLYFMIVPILETDSGDGSYSEDEASDGDDAYGDYNAPKDSTNRATDEYPLTPDDTDTEDFNA